MFPYPYLESTSDKNEEAEENSTETSKPCEREQVIITMETSRIYHHVAEGAREQYKCT